MLNRFSEPPPRLPFVLGVGAQKAGTTWLWRYISNCLGRPLSAVKEYHIWDARFVLVCRDHRISLFKVKRWNRNDFMRWRLQQSDIAVQNHFLGWSRRFSEGLTGDISPSYSGLATEHLIEIRRVLETAGFDLRVVFLMRDPVDRCLSAVRMAKRNHGDSIDDESLLAGLYNSPDFEYRTDYIRTIENLTNVFPAESLFIDFYERLFRPATLERLSHFLQIPCQPEFSRRRFNQAKHHGQISPEILNLVAEHYRDVYAYCFARFPEVSELWPRTRNLGLLGSL